MKACIRGFAWPLLVLYLAGVIGFAVATLTREETGWLLVTGCLLQAVFVLGAGTTDLHKPIGSLRLVLPAISAAVVTAVAIASVTLALIRVLRLDHWHSAILVLASLGALLIAAVVFFCSSRKWSRWETVKRLALVCLTVGAASLCVSVPSWHVMSRRAGFFQGAICRTAVIAGLSVVIWSIGPLIALVLLCNGPGNPGGTSGDFGTSGDTTLNYRKE